MARIEDVFGRLDAWRHLPNYQLERRADIFFSLYLSDALEARLGEPFSPLLIPEFPVRIGTIFPDARSNKSVKIDYLAVSKSGSRAALVELKTDGSSRREEQDRYLVAAREAGLEALLGGTLEIFRATKAKSKYYCLLVELEKLGLLTLPAKLHATMRGGSHVGSVALSRKITVSNAVQRCDVVYVQPTGVGDDVISFADFADVVRGHNDWLSVQFVRSLERWAQVAPGRPEDGPRH